MFTRVLLLAGALALNSAVVLNQQTASSASPAAAASNPVLAAWTGPYGGVPPWDKAKPELFPAAFEAALAEQRAEIAAIASETAPATFDNTIAAMERSGKTFDRVIRLFGVMRQNIGTKEFLALDREWQPKIAAADDEIAFNPALFKRIEAVYKSLGAASLSAEQKRLAERVYESFVRRGARLDDGQKAQLSKINQQLATLFSDFRSKVLADENTWIVVESEKDLAGLPAPMVSAAKAAAEERGLAEKWAIVNTRSSVDPFLTFSTRRDLRERVWKKFKSRGDNGDGNDTKATIAQIVKLRAERAKLLGFASHAHWRMSDTMAKDPKAAQGLMMRVWPAAVQRVREEVADMQSIAAKEGAATVIEPWDYLYYAEKVRKAKYDLDQGELKTYLELNNMVAAALWSAERRFNIKFSEITGKVPVFHPDVRVFEVTDSDGGAHRGLFYLDNFARAGKRSGAWASSYRVQHKLDDGAKAISSNNNNFVKGAQGEPVLISVDDATTLFHEFGHALHSLLQDVTYPGLSTTPRDFVEYPSQVNERWLLTREVLDRFAKHYKTGEPMPQALVDKIERASQFNQGVATLEYLAAAIVDMDLHMRPGGVDDISTFEEEALARVGGMPREVVLRHRLPHFDHLFGSDAYSAGYYSYLWADVMAADAWQAFVEAGGPWDADVNDRLRRHILSDGNSIDRAEAYRRFRGRDPEIQALLDARGFTTAESVETSHPAH
ncbi:MAG TPA: M3 family metallopeptidase, partial [Vicinamibacterales bacterium]|nr:M3 family metallopeptidase [Vicinamibacterales bacterium]